MAVAMTLACCAPPAFAQIYKCEMHGQIAFQDSPCPAQAKATVIETQPPPPKDMFFDLPPEPPPTMNDLLRGTSGYEPPARVSFDLLVPLIHKFEARKRRYQADMDRDIKTVRDHFYASLRDSGRSWMLTSDWTRSQREHSQRVTRLMAEDMRMHSTYATAMQAAGGASAPRGYGTQAPHARADAIARVHAEWDPKLRDVDAQLQAAIQDSSKQSQAYLAKLHAYQPTRDIHLVEKGLMEYERRVQQHWLPFIRITGLQIQGLKKELQRRCAADPVLAAQRQACKHLPNGTVATKSH